jgi:hypothetical protein
MYLCHQHIPPPGHACIQREGCEAAWHVGVVVFIVWCGTGQLSALLLVGVKDRCAAAGAVCVNSGHGAGGTVRTATWSARARLAGRARARRRPPRAPAARPCRRPRRAARPARCRPPPRARPAPPHGALPRARRFSTGRAHVVSRPAAHMRHPFSALILACSAHPGAPRAACAGWLPHGRRAAPAPPYTSPAGHTRAGDIEKPTKKRSTMQRPRKPQVFL